MSNEIIPLRELCRTAGFSRTTFYRMLGRGDVPEHFIVQMSGATCGYKPELVTWLRAYKQAPKDYRVLPKDEIPIKQTPAPTGEEVTVEDTPNHKSITTKSSRLRTLEDVLAYSEIDEKSWQVESCTVKSWEMGYKAQVVSEETEVGNVKTAKADSHMLYGISVKLRRIVTSPVDAAYALLEARIANHAPLYTPTAYTTPTDPHMLEIGLVDSHFGMLSWHKETGEDYDLNISQNIYTYAVEDIVNKASAYSIEKILLPVGSDFLACDNLELATTKGTPQDVDGRLAKIIETAQMAMVNAVERLRLVAPVEVVLVPGNHDFVSSFHIAHFIDAWFRNCGEVTVNTAPISRKYVPYGVTLIGLTHGDGVKQAELPLIMATEAKELWADTIYREWHIGHFHTERETRFTAVNGNAGVNVRVLPTLARTDRWSYSKGYISTKRAEGYVYSRANGPAGYVISYGGTKQ